MTAAGAPRVRGGDSRLRLEWRPFAFALPEPLRTAAGVLRRKEGWLLRLEVAGTGTGAADAGSPAAADRPGAPGAVGWGEAAPLEPASATLGRAIEALGAEVERQSLESVLPALPPCLAFALGAALGEVDGAIVDWRPAPASARLLPAGAAALAVLEGLRAVLPPPDSPAGAGSGGLCLKWKVAAAGDAEEREVLEALLQRLPRGARLRLDANGGWDRPTAWAWARRLEREPCLDWLEQPLDPSDAEGLEALARRVPVALDESLQQRPDLRRHWRGWQVRRPSQEGDPRPLLRQLAAGAPRLMLSTAFETGIGRRWLHHLAALQVAGPTPAAPGLAPGWTPEGELFAADPLRVWEAAA